jgi:hypothetical protein
MHRLIKLTLIVGVVFIAVLTLVRIGLELIRPSPLLVRTDGEDDERRLAEPAKRSATQGL